MKWRYGIHRIEAPTITEARRVWAAKWGRPQEPEYKEAYWDELVVDEDDAGQLLEMQSSLIKELDDQVYWLRIELNAYRDYCLSLEAAVRTCNSATSHVIRKMK